MNVNAGDPVHPGDARLFLRLVRGILNFYSLRDVSDSKSHLQTSLIFLRSLGNACQLILFVLVYSFMRLYLFDKKKCECIQQEMYTDLCAFRPVYRLLPISQCTYCMLVRMWYNIVPWTVWSLCGYVNISFVLLVLVEGMCVIILQHVFSAPTWGLQVLHRHFYNDSTHPFLISHHILKSCNLSIGYSI